MDLQGSVHLEDKEQARRAGPAVQLPLFGHRAVFDGSPDQRQHLLPQRVHGSEQPVVGHVEGLVGVNHEEDVAHGEHVEQMEAVLSLQAFPELVRVGVAGVGAQRLTGPEQLPTVAHGGEEQVQDPVLLVIKRLDEAVSRAAVLRRAEDWEYAFVRQRVEQRLFQRPDLHVALPKNTDHTQAVVPVRGVLLEVRLQQRPNRDGHRHPGLLHRQPRGNENTHGPTFYSTSGSSL